MSCEGAGRTQAVTEQGPGMGATQDLGCAPYADDQAGYTMPWDGYLHGTGDMNLLLQLFNTSRSPSKTCRQAAKQTGELMLNEKDGYSAIACRPPYAAWRSSSSDEALCTTSSITGLQVGDLERVLTSAFGTGKFFI